MEDFLNLPGLIQNPIKENPPSIFSELYSLAADQHSADLNNTTYEENMMEYLKKCPIMNIPEMSDKEKERQRIRQILSSVNFPHLDDGEKKHLEEIISTHRDIFHLPGEELNCIHSVHHYIFTTDEEPVIARNSELPLGSEKEVSRQIQYLLKNNIIRESDSPYNSPLRVEYKGGPEKAWNVSVDYSRLNKKILDDKHLPQNISELLDHVAEATYFSTFNLASIIRQIPIFPDDICKTAFSTPTGHYEYIRMPTSLKNAKLTLLIVLGMLLDLEKQIFVHEDNILIYTTCLTQHSITFARLANALRMANLKLIPSECTFLESSVICEGFLIDKTGLKVDPQQIFRISRFPTPDTIWNVNDFVTLMIPYNQFIPEFLKKVHPLARLIHSRQYQWKDQEKESFLHLQNVLTSESILQHPYMKQTFTLRAEADDDILRGVLSQDITNNLLIANSSRRLSELEKKYPMVEKEVLAIMHTLSFFNKYIFNKNKFTLIVCYSDRKPLEWLYSVKEPLMRFRQIKWELDRYNYDVIYLKRNYTKESTSSSNESEESVPSFLDQYYEEEDQKNAVILNELDESDKEKIVQILSGEQSD